jgi:aspartyl-tRNA(Asn)/glutamyl-tRNA(Gln) amidotransferase subunit B
MEWEVVIGLEVHAQLSTNTKIFSGASTEYGAAPNTQACAVDIALPGVLPVFNKGAAERAIKFGLAVGANINRESVFARKNYFYPDLPKGYQISQYELPIVEGGTLTIQVGDQEKVIRITRAHLEEDAGKSLHEDFHGMTGIDLNRAGTPLLEIVSEPDIRGSAEAVAYAKTLHSLVQYLEICDGNMQEGSFRCDANVSVRKKGADKFGTRCEIKNLNSFRFLERAIEYEVARQIDVIEGGGKITQETRLYDSDKDETRSMRSKEEAFDYRYFPDPDLLPLRVTEDMIEGIRVTLPELPHVKRARFVSQYGLSGYDAAVLTTSRAMAAYFEDVVAKVGDANAKAAANWVQGDLAGALNRDGKDIADSPISAAQLAGLIARILDNTISSKIAKEVFEAMWAGEGDADGIIDKKGLKQITDTGAIEKIVDEVIAANQKSVDEFKAGKERALNALVGQVMKGTKGKANPQQVTDLLKQKLGG